MISNYASSLILKGMTGRGNNSTSYTGGIILTTRAFLALSSTEPQKNGQGVTEPSGNGYARKQIGYALDTYGQAMGDPVNGVMTNKEEIHFNEATGEWGTLAYACIYDAETGGNLIASGKLGKTNTDTGEWEEQSITPVANSVVVIKEGNLKISIE